VSGDKVDGKIIIGKITTTHGHKGELKVLPLTDFPERFQEMNSVEVEINGESRVLHPETVRKHKQFFLIKFREIGDMNEAAAYRNSYLFIPKAHVKPLTANSYYHFQLKGLRVFTQAGEYLGRVEKILEPGGHDIFVVVEENTGRELMIPAVKAWVSEIDLENQRMIVNLLPGLV